MPFLAPCYLTLDIISLQGQTMVIDLGPEHIAPAPRIGTKLRKDFIKGMGKQNDRFVIILDIDQVFSADDLSCVHDCQAGTAIAATR